MRLRRYKRWRIGVMKHGETRSCITGLAAGKLTAKELTGHLLVRERSGAC